MKSILLLTVLLGGVAVTTSHAAPDKSNISTRHAQTLHFARGAHKLNVRNTIRGPQHRFYTLKMKAGQHLKISVESDAKTHSQLAPLIFVTPPCGKYNGDKTAIYNEDSSRKGIYLIEVAANTMASNANSGAFVLRVEAL